MRLLEKLGCRTAGLGETGVLWGVRPAIGEEFERNGSLERTPRQYVHVVEHRSTYFCCFECCLFLGACVHTAFSLSFSLCTYIFTVVVDHRLLERWKKTHRGGEKPTTYRYCAVSTR